MLPNSPSVFCKQAIAGGFAQSLPKCSCQLSLDDRPAIESAWLLGHFGRILAAQRRHLLRISE